MRKEEGKKRFFAGCESEKCPEENEEPGLARVSQIIPNQV